MFTIPIEPHPAGCFDSPGRSHTLHNGLEAIPLDAAPRLRHVFASSVSRYEYRPSPRYYADEGGSGCARTAPPHPLFPALVPMLARPSAFLRPYIRHFAPSIRADTGLSTRAGSYSCLLLDNKKRTQKRGVPFSSLAVCVYGDRTVNPRLTTLFCISIANTRAGDMHVYASRISSTNPLLQRIRVLSGDFGKMVSQLREVEPANDISRGRLTFACTHPSLAFHCGYIPFRDAKRPPAPFTEQPRGNT
ncbi:hypothetical protein B0H19DRAFT_1260624 [Mycena capillaripes]|nr:hypothetical protein B0H19DRAFT_1260624 [Mycena capillaripes]